MLKCQRNKFNIAKEYAYLNCAYMSPSLTSVHDKGADGLMTKSFPYEISRDDFFEPPKLLRQEFSKLINAQDADRIAILPSASYGLANVAKNIQIDSTQSIVLVGEQFPSNVYIWQRLAAENNANIVTINPPTSNENRGKIWNERLISSIDANTKVVAMAVVHWADGTLFDVEAISKRAKEVGAYFILDGTQSVGALPFDVQKVQPDALICSAYKWLLGPYSMAIGYFGEAFDDGVPIEENWINRLDSYQFENLVNYQPQYQPKAQRYNVGENSNFILVPMFIEALRQLNEWGVENINNYCNTLIQKPLRQLISMDCHIESLEYCSPHLFGVRLPRHINVDKLHQSFSENRVKVSVRGNSIRVAPNVYNDRSDFDRLLECFEEAVE